jgi:hypothetical protein
VEALVDTSEEGVGQRPSYPCAEKVEEASSLVVASYLLAEH